VQKLLAIAEMLKYFKHMLLGHHIIYADRSQKFNLPKFIAHLRQNVAPTAPPVRVWGRAGIH
jgi:hypothetical protein